MEKTHEKLNEAFTNLLKSKKRFTSEEDGTLREKTTPPTAPGAVLFTPEKLSVIDERLVPLLTYLRKHYARNISKILRLTWPYYQKQDSTVVRVINSTDYSLALLLNVIEADIVPTDAGLVCLKFEGVGLSKTTEGQWFVAQDAELNRGLKDSLVSTLWLDKHYPDALSRIKVGVAMGYTPRELASCVRNVYGDNLPVVSLPNVTT